MLPMGLSENVFVLIINLLGNCNQPPGQLSLLSFTW